MSPEQELEQAILEICARASAESRVSLVPLRTGGTPEGVRDLASRLLKREGQTSPGFRFLVKGGRFDLTFESLVLQARFRTLFSRSERIEARARLIDAIAAGVNAAIHGRLIGTLQSTRASRRGQRAAPLLFDEDVRRNEGCASHASASDELQFHIALVGFDRDPWCRYGVGFFLPADQSGVDLDALAPKIARFNEYMGAHGDRFAHLQIQHHRDGEVSSYDPGPIPGHFVRPPAFIFLGVHVPFDEFAVGRAVDLFGALMPLYHYVETGTEMPQSSAPTFRRPDRRPPAWAGQDTNQRLTVDRALRRRLLRLALAAHLEALHDGAGVVSTQDSGEAPTADITIHHNGAFMYYGIGTALTVRGCLREVLGRLLECAFRSDLQEPGTLVVVGEAEPGAADHAYLERLRAKLGLAVQYRRIDMLSERLL